MKELGWKAERGIQEMFLDSWRWQVNIPDGYTKEEKLIGGVKIPSITKS